MPPERSLYVGQEAIVRMGYGTTDWFKLGKGICQGSVLSPCLFNFCADYIMQNVVWMKQKLESRLLGEISISTNIQMITTLMAESEEELKSFLMKVKEESEKVGLKLNIQKTNIMASGPITSWQIDGETVETVANFILGGAPKSADGDCSHEIKRHLLHGRKVMTNLDSILKSKDIILLTKICMVKAMVFPVVMYGCENWTIKKAKH